MNRLRDEVGEDPIAERGIAMLRGVAPTAPVPEMKRRVWGALQQQRLRGTAMPGFGRLRFGAAVAIVLGVAGTAGAVIGQRWIFPSRSPVPAAAPAADTATRAARDHAAVRARARSADAPAPAAEAPAAVAPTPPAAPQTEARAKANTRAPRSRALALGHGSNGAPRSQASDATSARGLASALGAAPAAERTEVLDALVALRRDRDGVRAGQLLDAYLTAHPRGVLREEALVLAIEAADARGDAASAHRLARDYQTTYPAGRFNTYARDRTANARR